jgi:hypothetical protein
LVAIANCGFVVVKTKGSPAGSVCGADKRAASFRRVGNKPFSASLLNYVSFEARVSSIFDFRISHDGVGPHLRIPGSKKYNNLLIQCGFGSEIRVTGGQRFGLLNHHTGVPEMIIAFSVGCSIACPCRRNQDQKSVRRSGESRLKSRSGSFDSFRGHKTTSSPGPLTLLHDNLRQMAAAPC